MSFLLVLARPQISAFKFACAINFTACRSPSDTIGKPASIASTPSASSFFAMSSFCSGDNATPGVCSPSLSVVSNILTLMPHSSVMQLLLYLRFLICQMALLILQMQISDQVSQLAQPL